MNSAVNAPETLNWDVFVTPGNPTLEQADALVDWVVASGMTRRNVRCASDSHEGEHGGAEARGFAESCRQQPPTAAPA